MLESFRIWYPDMAVTVYALEIGWRDEFTHRLRDDYSVTVSVLPESNQRNRGGANIGSGAIHALWKLDAILDQDQPFLILDGDILVLKPFDDLIRIIETEGWFSVHEGTGLCDYHQGEIKTLTRFKDVPIGKGSMNTGVLGCDPARHRQVFETARRWGSQISNIFLGDQGLINLAYYEHYKTLPINRGSEYNGGWTIDGKVDLRQTILHFGGPKAKNKLNAQRLVWNGWPKGCCFINLVDTDFWKNTQPHPWRWLNQCNQSRHRSFVAKMRAKSRWLMDESIDWLIVENAYQAYLLDNEVLQQINKFWRQHGSLLSKVPHKPTYHLSSNGQPTFRLGNWFKQRKYRLQSMI